MREIMEITLECDSYRASVGREESWLCVKVIAIKIMRKAELPYQSICRICNQSC